MENIAIVLLISFYLVTARKMFYLLSYVGGLKLLYPSYLVIKEMPWNVTLHGFCGSIFIPIINTFTLMVYVFAYDALELPRPDTTIWLSQAMAIVYPLYNHVQVWRWNRTERKERF